MKEAREKVFPIFPISSCPEIGSLWRMSEVLAPEIARNAVRSAQALGPKSPISLVPAEFGFTLLSATRPVIAAL
jgi:hypothetical protein